VASEASDPLDLKEHRHGRLRPHRHQQRAALHRRHRRARAGALGILGTATGAPVTQSLTLQVFDADDGVGTNALPLKPDGSHAAASVTGATASGAMTQLGVKFQNCRKWVKVRGVYANTGGATPKNDVAVALVLGGARETPTRGPNP
jgi:hypothetical protein